MAARRTVLYIEATKGGVVGGSLTGLHFLVRGLDKSCYRPVVVLYEAKAIARDLERAGATVVTIARARIKRPPSLAKHPTVQRLRGRVRLLKAAGRVARIAYQSLAVGAYNAVLLYRVVRREQVDIIHQNNGIASSLEAILAARASGARCVSYEKSFSRLSVVDRWVGRRLDRVLCVSNAVRVHFVGQGLARERLTVVYDGIDADHFRPGPQDSIRHALGIDARAFPLVAIVGNIQEWKGQRVVVEAVARLRSPCPDIRCLVVGGVHKSGQQYAAELREWVRRHDLEDRVIFTGPRRDVPDIMNAADILVHASIRPDPLPRVVLEGMLLGRPMVASAVGGVPEMITDGSTGRLVPPGDADAMADAIRALAADRQAAVTMGRRAAEVVTRRFDARQHAAAVEAVYRSVLA